MIDRIGFSGTGLHSAQRCSVTLVRAPGPFRLGPPLRQYARHELRLVRSDSGVSVGSEDGFVVDLVEHLFGACAGLGIQDELTVLVEGPEVPLLDGGAKELAQALVALGIEPKAPRLVLARPGELEIGESRYRFEPAAVSRVVVDVDFAPFGPQTAEWDGTPTGFLAEIAAARTFGFRSQAAELRARGRANFVNPRSVMVLESDGRVVPPGLPPRHGELGRHKLLDLLGDLYLYGGPPRGSIHATRPGHRNNHSALLEGLASGLLEWALDAAAPVAASPALPSPAVAPKLETPETLAMSAAGD